MWEKELPVARYGQIPINPYLFRLPVNTTCDNFLPYGSNLFLNAERNKSFICRVNQN
jgi:hypothetical protein